MKIRYYCYRPVCSDGTVMSVMRNAVVLDAATEATGEYNSYLLSALDTDFNENRYGDVDATLLAIGRLECGEIDSYETGGLGFEHTLTRNYVRFEHSIFGECPEWPIWYCTLAQYKAALEGYRRFLDMPKSIDSELIVELPEGEPDVAER